MGSKNSLGTLANGLTGHLAIDSVRASDNGMVRKGELNEVLQKYSEAEGGVGNYLSVNRDRIFSDFDLRNILNETNPIKGERGVKEKREKRHATKTIARNVLG